jgi:hypothetical protein
MMSVNIKHSMIGTLIKIKLKIYAYEMKSSLFNLRYYSDIFIRNLEEPQHNLGSIAGLQTHIWIGDLSLIKQVC